MSTVLSGIKPLQRARIIADFQFGEGVGRTLFPDTAEFGFSSTRKVRYVLLNGMRLATLRASDGRLTLSMEGAERLRQALSPPNFRVTIDPSVDEYVAMGRNAMAKHIISADPGIRAGDEVLVVTNSDELLATGTAMLSGEEMLAFKYGVAVNVRKGRNSK